MTIIRRRIIIIIEKGKEERSFICKAGQNGCLDIGTIVDFIPIKSAHFRKSFERIGPFPMED